MTSPWDNEESVLETVGAVKQTLPRLLKRYIPGISRIPLDQGMSWDPTWKSLPTHMLTRQVLMMRRGLPKQKVASVRSCFTSLAYELGAWTDLVRFVHARGEQWSQGALWPKVTRYALDDRNKIISGNCLDYFEKFVGPLMPTCEQLGVPMISGRLGCSVEGAGKRRIFAIGNYINQRLLYPVHCWLMKVLASIPTDGTFNQTRPLDRLVGKTTCYSFDLKSATDRWPLVFMFEVLQACFDRSFASSAVNSALATNIFEVPFVRRRNSQICFVAGQPLGYYSSWPLFALSHHILVWACAEEVYPGREFLDYAVLGDDVVIADPSVAALYEARLSGLGVTISYQKSLISSTGAAEFYKRFRTKQLTVDLSPVSVKNLLNCHHPYGLMAVWNTYPIRRFSTVVRVGGGSRKQLERLTHSRRKHFDRVFHMYIKSLNYQYRKRESYSYALLSFSHAFVGQQPTLSILLHYSYRKDSLSGGNHFFSINHASTG